MFIQIRLDRVGSGHEKWTRGQADLSKCEHRFRKTPAIGVTAVDEVSQSPRLRVGNGRT